MWGTMVLAVELEIAVVSVTNFISGRHGASRRGAEHGRSLKLSRCFAVQSPPLDVHQSFSVAMSRGGKLGNTVQWLSHISFKI